jgi:hypothetical protein
VEGQPESGLTYHKRREKKNNARKLRTQCFFFFRWLTGIQFCSGPRHCETSQWVRTLAFFNEQQKTSKGVSCPHFWPNASDDDLLFCDNVPLNYIFHITGPLTLRSIWLKLSDVQLGRAWEILHRKCKKWICKDVPHSADTISRGGGGGSNSIFAPRLA